MPDKPCYCYILWSDTAEKFYIGVTENVRKRLDDHNSGVSKWTKRFAGSWRLVWQSQFVSLGDARRFEKRLKRQKGGAGFWKITGLGPSAFGKSGS